jgi:SAM-dependent methyltransferase
MDWWTDFFDDTYLKLWSPLHSPETCEQQAQDLIDVLQLNPGDRVLDAPCGYGRITLPLASRGLRVTGLDLSAPLLRVAKERAKEVQAGELVDFVQADLRDAKINGGFQAAINLFSSVGYGTEEDDERMMRTIHDALAPGGKLYLETMHRDALVTRRALGEVPGFRATGGMTVREKNRFDPTSGRIHSTWTWNSPTASGSRKSNMRLYAANELADLLRRAGFATVECRVGISNDAFSEDTLNERLGLFCTKAAS